MPAAHLSALCIVSYRIDDLEWTTIGVVKLEFHDADTDNDTDILARILADTSDTRDFLKLFLWQAEEIARIGRNDV